MGQKLLSPLIILSVFTADRITKYFVLKFIEFKSYAITGFLSFNYVENTGVAFGMFSGVNSFFIVFTVILILIAMIGIQIQLTLVCQVVLVITSQSLIAEMVK